MSQFSLPKSALIVASDTHFMTEIAVACQLDGFTLHQVSSTQEASENLKLIVPSVVILDTETPFKECDLAWVRDVRQTSRTAGMAIMITSRLMCVEAMISALDAGADDFITHSGSASELQARIRAILRSRAPELSEDEIEFGPLIIRPRDREALNTANGTLRRTLIGATQFRLLYFLVSHPNIVHSREALRNRLWSIEDKVSDRTVDAQVRRLRSVLAPLGLDALVETVLRTGYRLSLPKAPSK